MEGLEIITTSDGSHTLRNTALNETYHSVHGAVQESMHVFIGAGLEYYGKHHRGEWISILEVGFGTGLNALLSLQHTMHADIRIHYTAIEPFPLTKEVWSVLNYGDPEHGGHLYRALHEAAWNQEVSISAEFIIQKRDKLLQDVELNKLYDIIYFDAFAPQVQPALWSYESLQKVVSHMKHGGVFVTYSARGQLKRDLKGLGLSVETLPGPPGKNEMVRGVSQ